MCYFFYPKHSICSCHIPTFGVDWLNIKGRVSVECEKLFCGEVWQEERCWETDSEAFWMLSKHTLDHGMLGWPPSHTHQIFFSSDMLTSALTSKPTMLLIFWVVFDAGVADGWQGWQVLSEQVCVAYEAFGLTTRPERFVKDMIGVCRSFQWRPANTDRKRISTKSNRLRFVTSRPICLLSAWWVWIGWMHKVWEDIRICICLSLSWSVCASWQVSSVCVFYPTTVKNVSNWVQLSSATGVICWLWIYSFSVHICFCAANCLLTVWTLQRFWTAGQQDGRRCFILVS